jgi:hypothetical protein
MTNVKFTGPLDKIKLNFRKLPTPMVEWEGTAKDLHDILIKAALAPEQEERGPTTQGEPEK